MHQCLIVPAQKPNQSPLCLSVTLPLSLPFSLDPPLNLSLLNILLRVPLKKQRLHLRILVLAHETLDGSVETHGRHGQRHRQRRGHRKRVGVASVSGRREQIGGGDGNGGAGDRHVQARRVLQGAGSDPLADAKTHHVVVEVVGFVIVVQGIRSADARDVDDFWVMYP